MLQLNDPVTKYRSLPGIGGDVVVDGFEADDPGFHLYWFSFDSDPFGSSFGGSLIGELQEKGTRKGCDTQCKK